ncbi:MAG: prepilin-type N-terminal cleavage/methylation domain-containing protein [Candidatus Omnitrophota bacterium]|nr:prepilin-type N-terminal cleavage/methylation domain-containing protein [Candidatus Omnitrophota bacterium]
MKTKIGKKGFTLVEIMIVVAIIGLLAAIAIPNFVRARQRAQESACIANLRQIEGAIQVWAVDNGKGDTDAVLMLGTQATGLVPTYIKTEPFCPSASGASYVPVDAATRPVCPVVAGNPGHVLP